MPSRVVARCGLIAAALLFAACLAIVLIGAPVLRAPAPVAGSPASGFTLPDADEHLVSLESSRGRVVLLCIADPQRCGTEPLSFVAEIQHDYSNDARVMPMTVLRTDIEPGTIRARDLVENLAEAGITGTRLLDGNSDVWRQYRVDNDAAMFVIDRQGVIRYRSTLRGDRELEIARARRVIDQLIPVDAVASSVR